VICVSYDSTNKKLRVQFNFERSLKERQWDRANGYSSVIIGCMPNLNLWMITPRRDECKHDGRPRDFGRASQLYLRGAIADPAKSKQFANFVAYAQAFHFLQDSKNQKNGIQGFVYDQPPSNPRGPEDVESERDAGWYGTGNQGVIASNEGIGMALWESFKQVKPGDRRPDLAEIAAEGGNALQPFPNYFNLTTSGQLKSDALTANILDIRPPDTCAGDETVREYPDEILKQVETGERIDDDEEKIRPGRVEQEFDIFISHSQQADESDPAENLARALGDNLRSQAANQTPPRSVFFTSDNNPDHGLKQNIVTAISQAKVAVIFLSARSQPHWRYDNEAQPQPLFTGFISQPWEIYHLLRRVIDGDDLKLFIIPITSWNKIYSDGWPGPLGKPEWGNTATWVVKGADDPSKFNADEGLLKDAQIDQAAAEDLKDALMAGIWLRKSSDNSRGSGKQFFAPDSDIFRGTPDNLDGDTYDKHVVIIGGKKSYLKFMLKPDDDSAFKELFGDIKEFLDTGKGVK
jgi:hypothetical protein